MQDELEEKSWYYCSVPHKDWSDLLYTMEAKDNRKRATYEIKILAASKAAPANYDSDMSARVPHKKKEMNGVLPAHKN